MKILLFKEIIWKFLYWHINKLVSILKLVLVDQTREAELLVLLEKLHPVTPERELIRIGPFYDGGYLVPNDLEGISACFSPGVAYEVGFEYDLAERGIQIYMADYSIERLPINHHLFNFKKKFVGSFSNDKFISMKDWVSENLEINNELDLILQMDIEGFEYETLFSIPDDLLIRFRIIVIEFHKLDRLADKLFFKFYSRVFEKLLQNHKVVHIHPNNISKITKLGKVEIPELMEFTFYRNDRGDNFSNTIQFPNKLDSKNIAKAEITLPKCWYRSL